MKGFLIKEYYSSKIYGRNFLFMLALLAVLSIVFKFGGSYITMMLMMYLIVVSIGLYSVDDASKWDRFAVCLPVKRSTIVGARYLFLVLYMFGVMVLAFALGIVMSLVGGETPDYFQLAATTGAGALAFLFINAVLAPVVYKVGAEKARIAMIVIAMVPVLAVALLVPQLEGHLAALLTSAILPWLIAGGAVLIVALYIISWRVSAAIYGKKEY